MSSNYKVHNPTAPYCVSLATVHWIDVFTRQVYFEVLADRIAYCRKKKGLERYAYNLIPSHVPLLLAPPKGLILRGLSRN